MFEVPVVRGTKLDTKGIDSWLRKVAGDRAIGDMWRAKLEHVHPKRMAKELQAAIEEDQASITSLMKTVTEACASSDRNNVNVAVNTAHKFLDTYAQNITAVSIHCSAHEKASNPRPKAKAKGKGKSEK